MKYFNILIKHTVNSEYKFSKMNSFSCNILLILYLQYFKIYIKMNTFLELSKIITQKIWKNNTKYRILKKM